MNLVILGATGGTGRLVVEQALAAGHTVTALVRDPSRLPARPGLRVVEADLDDPQRLAAEVHGQDAVICTLGAPARDREGVRARGTRSTVAAMQAAGVRRIVALSSYGVGDSWARLPLWIRYTLVPLVLRRAFADHEVQERLLRESGLDWTILRPPFLTDAAGGGPVSRGDDLVGTKMKIPRADVARELLTALTDRSTFRRAVGIASA